ncbi:MAG: hypothetical protein JO247_15110 [Chloroflexi bacterium]|nr:hypothetical protein [Chloroflexota bacterium]
MDLYWQVATAPAAIPPLQLAGVNLGGTAGASTITASTTGTAGDTTQTGLGDMLPPAEWPNGVLEDRRNVTLPATARGGGAALTIGGVELGQVTITEPNRDFTLPAVQHPLDVRVGDFAQLTGYGLEAEAGRLTVTLVWRARATTSTSYKGFVHLLDADNRVLTQQDQLPQAGAMPTTFWVPDQVVTDTYQLTLPAQVPPGSQLEVGLYDPASGKRVDLGGQDRLLLPLNR